jgi:hypothetical protein
MKYGIWRDYDCWKCVSFRLNLLEYPNYLDVSRVSCIFLKIPTIKQWNNSSRTKQESSSIRDSFPSCPALLYSHMRSWCNRPVSFLPLCRTLKCFAVLNVMKVGTCIAQSVICLDCGLDPEDYRLSSGRGKRLFSSSKYPYRLWDSTGLLLSEYW